MLPKCGSTRPLGGCAHFQSEAQLYCPGSVLLCTELRTPIRSSGEEENEDTAQLQKDIQRVRDALQAEGEATSKMRADCADAESPAAVAMHTGKSLTCQAQ